MKRFRKVYLEITNVCNLRCSFCPGTSRDPKMMDEQDFVCLLKKLSPWTDYLYFHLMGEPLIHPDLSKYLQLAHENGFRVILTTNGTLLKKNLVNLLDSPALHKVNISLQSFEANDSSLDLQRYTEDCISFAKASEGRVIVVFRLWNIGGLDQLNEGILRALKVSFADPWVEERKGIRLGEKVYLEFGEKFDWPDKDADLLNEEHSCYGLKDQIGVLCDGRVVPCCLDHEGTLILGNLLEDSMEDILESDRAKRILKGFSEGRAVEDLCKKCGFATRFVR